ncbi:SDR family NAD(P)-dependent oxidoreductase [Mesorhizobium sp. M0159]|uniref:SDR family NAD(P)-dependent oxidoreductase n=1 Tax=Mesorhizobium sp. M0159 TaxID=2956900 RepID=UPI0033388DD7
MALVDCPALAAYCASKGAVVLLTRAMALDHAKEQISIKSVSMPSALAPLIRPRSCRP